MAGSHTIKRTAKFLLSTIWYAARQGVRVLEPKLAGRAKGYGVVLYYHTVGPRQRKSFARQLDNLLSRAVPWQLGTPLPDDGALHVAITFDDAYACVLEYAWPEMQQRHIPFTVFVPTGCWGRPPLWVDRANHPFHQERVITMDELRDLAAEPLVTIGSHTVTHPRLSKLCREEVRRELAESKATLENLLGRSVDLFSFPHGDWTNGVVRQALVLGYRQLFTVDPCLVRPPGLAPLLGRFAVEPEDGPLSFRLKLAGAYGAWRTARCALAQPGSSRA